MKFLMPIQNREASTPEIFYQRSALKIFSVPGFQDSNFIKKRVQHRCFSCEYYEIFKNTYFGEHLALADSWNIKQ